MVDVVSTADRRGANDDNEMGQSKREPNGRDASDATKVPIPARWPRGPRCVCRRVSAAFIVELPIRVTSKLWPHRV